MHWLANLIHWPWYVPWSRFEEACAVARSNNDDLWSMGTELQELELRLAAQQVLIDQIARLQGKVH